MALTHADLAAGRVLYPIRIDEHGTELPLDEPFDKVATGTLGTGVAAVDHCDGWTSTTGNFVRGSIHGSGHLFTSYYSTNGCSLSARLYCFGVDRVATVSIAKQPGRIAFLSKGSWLPGGGLPGADALCQDEAFSASLAGSFIAALATSTASASSRLNLLPGSWVRPDGLPLTGATSVLSGGLDIGLALHADGSYPAPRAGGDNDMYQTVWTGAVDGNSVANAACGDWLVNSGGAGSVGKAGMTNGQNFYLGWTICSQSHQLYCMQQ